MRGATAASSFAGLTTAAADALPEAFHALVEFSILASVIDPFDPMEKAFHRLGQHFLHRHRASAPRLDPGARPTG